LPRFFINLGLACAAALATAACSSSLFESDSYNNFMSKPLRAFDRPEWATDTKSSRNFNLGPSGPVAPEDMVSGDGRCAEPAPPAAVAAAPAAAPAAPAQPAAPAPPSDRLEPEVAPGGPPPAPALTGGVTLGMSECQVVRRIGTPNNVSIGDEKGERKVVLSYLEGNWPGIYQFQAGRLKAVDAAPVPDKPAKPAPKKKAKKKPAHDKAARREIERGYVQ